ncbi:hypothetical protein BSIN_3525 [Burkholderia singularis]|uniref:Uncharacterized protein n=1 Tax=Burkholderia singularis TaxID=1503053 RepID=A0A238H570_9BURK|nr:hypothetical protein BSIN_3525 [Burkholderia singularis]
MVICSNFERMIGHEPHAVKAEKPPFDAAPPHCERAAEAYTARSAK